MMDKISKQEGGEIFTRIVSSCEVVGGVLLAGDELLRVEQLAICTGPHLIDDGGLEVDEDCPWHVLPRARLAEESVERIMRHPDSRVAATTNQAQIHQFQHYSTKHMIEHQMGIIYQHRRNSKFSTKCIPEHLMNTINQHK